MTKAKLNFKLMLAIPNFAKIVVRAANKADNKA